MLQTSRTVFSDNGTLSDISVDMNDFQNGTFVMAFVNGEDYLYIGSDFPFNHRYIDVSVVNANSASLSVDLWDGDEWKAALDVIDETAIAGVPLAQSGHISWRKDEDETWSREDTNNNNNQITGLTGVNIFDLYWARLSWSADLSATTALKYIGHKFSEDNDLEVEYPQLNESEVKDRFKSSKTDWNDQHVQAAIYIIKDLKKNQVLLSKNQILEWKIFREASYHKVAEMAYNRFGPDFEKETKAAKAAYIKALSESIDLIDINRNAVLDRHERSQRQGFGRR